MCWPAPRSNIDILRILVIGAGLCWSIAFGVVALHYELQHYADGAIFSYAVAVQDVWAFHWHNISPRVSVFFLTLWPAELYVGLTGDPRNGIRLYGFLFYVAPVLALIGTFAADRSRRRIIFTYACGSTALLCPMVFGFPTEMWLAHALFWPTLAVCQYARRSSGGTALVLVMMIALALSHEGALILAAAIVLTLALRGLSDTFFLRAAGALLAALTIWMTVKVIFRPDDYFADALMRAARHFFDLTVFQIGLVLLLTTTLVSYVLIYLALSRLVPGKAYLYATATAVMALAVYWLWFDHSLHASNRYYLRTALVLVTPLLGIAAGLYAMRADGLTLLAPGVERFLTKLTSGGVVQATIGAFLLVTLVHAVETKKFVVAWERYKSMLAALATGSASDPALGDPRFVSSERISPDLNQLSWNSTTPYLSVITANFVPNRLVVDPTANYFWLSCEMATANYRAVRSIPDTTRNLVKIYSCLHR
ncbi:MAG: hypothetical protein WB475_02460 [Pseudolabrys sp.]